MKQKSMVARNALSTVSYLFLFVGLLALAAMVRHAAQGTLRFNFGVLGIGVFFGLRRFSRLWRYVALLSTCYGIITLCVALFICLNGQPPAPKFMFYSQRMSSIPPHNLAIPLLMVLFVSFWQYRILTHPAIRRLFNDTTRPSTPEAAPVTAPLNGVTVK
jgi:hypothetical protein